LINSNRLTPIEEGILKRVLDKGEEALSEKQFNVYQEALSKYTTKYCKHCGSAIPIEERLEAEDNGGLCAHCAHQLEKLMSE